MAAIGSGSSRIRKFTEDGEFLKAVGTEGDKPLQFSFPTDIACYGNLVYVVDKENYRVLTLNSDLTSSSTFIEYSIGKGSQLAIACDKTGKVYVTNCVFHTQRRTFVDTGYKIWPKMPHWCCSRQ